MNKNCLIVPKKPRSFYLSNTIFVPSFGPISIMLPDYLSRKASNFWFRSVVPRHSHPLNIFRPNFYFEVPEDHVIWRPDSGDFKIIVEEVPVLDEYRGTADHKTVETEDLIDN